MYQHPEMQYINVLRDLVEMVENGELVPDRTGTGVAKVTAVTQKFYEVDKQFPLLTTRRMSKKVAAAELAWIISGDTNIRPLVMQNVHIWNEWPLRRFLNSNGQESVMTHSKQWDANMKWFIDKIRDDTDFANKWGDLGPTYGKQMRIWSIPSDGAIDQLSMVIHALNNNPYSRRINITLWNPGEVPLMALPPCLFYYQFTVLTGNRLVLTTIQRSADFFIGSPHNIATSAMMLLIVAHLASFGEVAYKPWLLNYVTIDTHLYQNLVDEAKTQIFRPPLPWPSMSVSPDLKSIDAFSPDHLILTGYQSHPAISTKGKVAV